MKLNDNNILSFFLLNYRAVIISLQFYIWDLALYTEKDQKHVESLKIC
jgi:hypothetical protein